MPHFGTRAERVNFDPDKTSSGQYWGMEHGSWTRVVALLVPILLVLAGVLQPTGENVARIPMSIIALPLVAGCGLSIWYQCSLLRDVVADCVLQVSLICTITHISPIGMQLPLVACAAAGIVTWSLCYRQPCNMPPSSLYHNMTLGLCNMATWASCTNSLPEGTADDGGATITFIVCLWALNSLISDARVKVFTLVASLLYPHTLDQESPAYLHVIGRGFAATMEVDQRAKKASEYAPSLVGAILGAGLGYILPKIGKCVERRFQAKRNATADLESGLGPQADRLAAATLGQLPSESRDTFYTAQVELDEMSPTGDVGLAPPLPPPRAHLSRI